MLDLARREAVVESGDAADVGELVDAVPEGEHVVTVRFAADVEGYRGWRRSPARGSVVPAVAMPGAASCGSAHGAGCAPPGACGSPLGGPYGYDAASGCAGSR